MSTEAKTKIDINDDLLTSFNTSHNLYIKQQSDAIIELLKHKHFRGDDPVIMDLFSELITLCNTYWSFAEHCIIADKALPVPSDKILKAVMTMEAFHTTVATIEDYLQKKDPPIED